MAEYIDRDALKKQMASFVPFVIDASNQAYVDGLTDAYTLICQAPAADVVERKTGKWIEIKRNDVNPITGKCGVYVGCSECGAPLPTDSMLDFINESDCKFCYNCGTKMEVLIN